MLSICCSLYQSCFFIFHPTPTLNLFPKKYIVFRICCLLYHTTCVLVFSFISVFLTLQQKQNTVSFYQILFLLQQCSGNLQISKKATPKTFYGADLQLMQCGLALHTSVKNINLHQVRIRPCCSCSIFEILQQEPECSQPNLQHQKLGKDKQPNRFMGDCNCAEKSLKGYPDLGLSMLCSAKGCCKTGKG